jgi:hypothetical protein
MPGYRNRYADPHPAFGHPLPQGEGYWRYQGARFRGILRRCLRADNAAMTLVTLECPHCRGMMQVDAAAAGQQIACPLCQGTMQVPPADVLAAAMAPPAPPEGPSPAPPPGFGGGLPGVPVALMPLACPACGGMFQVPPSTAGMQLPCPACGQLVTIPEPSALTAAAPPAAAEASDSPPLAPAAACEPAATNDPVLSLNFSLDVASLLPPGAAAAGAAPQGQAAAPAPAWDVRTLLPPGAEAAGTPGQQMPLPSAPRPILVSQTAGLQGGPKVVGPEESATAIRRLTPAEKNLRRTIKRVVLFILCLAGLLAIVIYMSR